MPKLEASKADRYITDICLPEYSRCIKAAKKYAETDSIFEPWFTKAMEEEKECREISIKITEAEEMPETVEEAQRAIDECHDKLENLTTRDFIIWVGKKYVKSKNPEQDFHCPHGYTGKAFARVIQDRVLNRLNPENFKDGSQILIKKMTEIYRIIFNLVNNLKSSN